MTAEVAGRAATGSEWDSKQTNVGKHADATCGASEASAGDAHTGDTTHRAASTVASHVIELGDGICAQGAVQRFCMCFASSSCNGGNNGGGTDHGSSRPDVLGRAQRFHRCTSALHVLAGSAMGRQSEHRPGWGAWLPVEIGGEWQLLPLAGDVLGSGGGGARAIVAGLRGACKAAKDCSDFQRRVLTAVEALLLLDCALAHIVPPHRQQLSLAPVSILRVSRRAPAAAAADALRSLLAAPHMCGNCTRAEACGWRHAQTKTTAVVLAGWANVEPLCVAARPAVLAVRAALQAWSGTTSGAEAQQQQQQQQHEETKQQIFEGDARRSVALRQWWKCRAAAQREAAAAFVAPRAGFRAQMAAVWDTMRLCAPSPAGGPWRLDAAGARVADGTVYIRSPGAVCLDHAETQSADSGDSGNPDAGNGGAVVTGLVVHGTSAYGLPELRVAASLGALLDAHVAGSVSGGLGDDAVKSFPVLSVRRARHDEQPAFGGDDSGGTVPAMLVGLYPYAYPNFGHWLTELLLPLSTELPQLAAAALQLAAGAASRSARLVLALVLPRSPVAPGTLPQWELLEALASDAVVRQQHGQHEQLRIEVVVTTLDGARRTLGGSCVAQVALYSSQDHFSNCCQQIGGQEPARDLLLRELGATLRRSARRAHMPIPPPPLRSSGHRLVLLVERRRTRRILNGMVLLQACRSVVARAAAVADGAAQAAQAARGCERVNFEKLRFVEAAALLRRAAVLVGMHGAGLANALLLEATALWTPAVLEIMPYRLEECEWARSNIAGLATGLGLQHVMLLASKFPDILPRSLRRMEATAAAAAAAGRGGGDGGGGGAVAPAKAAIAATIGSGGATAQEVDSSGGFTVMHATSTLPRPPQEVLAEQRPFSCAVGKGALRDDIALAFRDQDTAVDVPAFSRALAAIFGA